MAAIIGQRTQLGFKKTGHSVTVADNPRAKLMYYLNCVTTVLEMNDSNLNRLKNYERYYNLDDEEEQLLLGLVLLLSPDLLIDKVFFQSDELCGDSSNKFFEITHARNFFAVQQNILIGGARKRIVKIMTFKTSWLYKNYINPLQEFQRMLEYDAERERRQIEMSRAVVSSGDSNCCCTIL